MMRGRVAAMRVMALAAPIWRSLATDDCVRVLAYHGVPDPEAFRMQMKHVADHYRPVSDTDVMGWLSGRTLPPKACWLTFDDGETSVVRTGLPILDERAIPATMFVCPGVIDTNEPFWWQVVGRAAELGIESGGKAVDGLTISRLKIEPDYVREACVRELAEAVAERTGAEFRSEQLTLSELRLWIASGRGVGNHTWTHPMLDRSSIDEQHRQIQLAHDWLTENVGRTEIFAYPNGNRTQESEDRLRSLGYRMAVMFDHRVLATRSRPMAISRLRVNADDRMAEFTSRVSGLHSWVHRRLLFRN